MKRGPVVLLAVLIPLALRAARPQQTAPYTYQGTIQAVQLKAGSLDLITGVGMALRLVHVQTTSGTHIANGSAPLALGDLKPGTVIRAECHPSDQGPVADRIEKVAVP
jgi:hypothetical protein